MGNMIVAEVGCQGYIPPAFRKALQHFGFNSNDLQACVDECALVRRGSSNDSWINSFHQNFIPELRRDVTRFSDHFVYITISTLFFSRLLKHGIPVDVISE